MTLSNHLRGFLVRTPSHRPTSHLLTTCRVRKESLKRTPSETIDSYKSVSDAGGLVPSPSSLRVTRPRPERIRDAPSPSAALLAPAPRPCHLDSFSSGTPIRDLLRAGCVFDPKRVLSGPQFLSLLFLPPSLLLLRFLVGSTQQARFASPRVCGTRTVRNGAPKENVTSEGRVPGRRREIHVFPL